MATRTDPKWFPTPGERERARVTIAAIARVERELNRLEARKSRLLALLMDDALAQQARADATGALADDLPLRSVAAEVAAMTRSGQRTVLARMDEAWRMRERFPKTMAALEGGGLSRQHARVIVDEGARLADDKARAAYEERSLERAGCLTVPGLREECRRIAEGLQPVPMAERHREARAERRVFVRGLDDGMAELCLIAPAVIVHGAHDRLTAMAKSVQRAAHGQSTQSLDHGPAGAAGVTQQADDGTAGAVDPRTLDQLRADIAADLLLTGHPNAHAVHDDSGSNTLDGIRGTVQVTIPAPTLIGLGDDVAFLAGYGPIDPDTARRLAANTGGWERLFRNPDTGALLTVDHYTPTAAQRRFLHARDEHCRFPGCRQPARRCDLDHTTPHADGGPTTVTNLACLCRGHHVLKHHSPWRVRQRADGELEWTTPTGAVCIDRPEPSVRFVDTEDLATTTASGDPPPF